MVLKCKSTIFFGASEINQESSPTLEENLVVLDLLKMTPFSSSKVQALIDRSQILYRPNFSLCSRMAIESRRDIIITKFFEHHYMIATMLSALLTLFHLNFTAIPGNTGITQTYRKSFQL